MVDHDDIEDQDDDVVWGGGVSRWIGCHWREDVSTNNAVWLIDGNMVVYLNGKEVGIAGRVDGRVIVRLNRQVDLDVATASGLIAFVESVTHTFQ